MKLKSFYLGFFCIAISFFLLALVWQQEATGQEFKAYNLSLFDKDKLLKSPINRESFWFEIKPGVTLGNNCFINVSYSHSATLINEESLITVMLNNIPLASRRLAQADINQTDWKIPLPIDKTIQGYNEIRIITGQRTIEGICRDVDNDANWLILYDKSFLHLEATDVELNLKNFPYPFLNYLSNQPVNCTWYLPKNPGTEEIKTMLQLAGNWGRLERSYNLPIKVKLGEPEKSAENQLLIGILSHWPSLLNKQLTKGIGVLSIDRSPNIKGGKRFLISGTDEEGLFKAQAALNSPELLSQMEGDTFLVKDMPYSQNNKKTLGKPGSYTLSELGYSDIVMGGAFHQRTGLTLKKPAGWYLGSATEIEAHFRHSTSLDPARSALTVYINGRPLNSVVLNAANAENGVLKVKIPTEELEKSQWLIEFAFYHDIGAVDCSKSYDEVAWSVVESSTTVSFIKGNGEIGPSLLNFPDLKVDTNNGNKATMWLSSEPDEEELTLAAIITAKAAKNNGLSIDWSVITSDSPDEKLLQGSPVIMIVYQNEKERLAKIRGYIPVWPDGQYSYEMAQNLNLVPSDKGNALIEASLSPWDKSNILYTLIGFDKSFFEKLSLGFAEMNIEKQLNGQLCELLKDGRIVSFTTEISEKEKAKKSSWGIINIFKSNTVLIYGSILGAVVIIMLVTLLIAHKRSR